MLTAMFRHRLIAALAATPPVHVVAGGLPHKGAHWQQSFISDGGCSPSLWLGDWNQYSVDIDGTLTYVVTVVTAVIPLAWRV